jgi:hypothetical protein
MLVRLGVREAPKHPLVLPFKRPRDVKRLLQARRNHFVLRYKPDCIMVDFTQHLGSMSMSKMQLLCEVGVPYFCHDLTSFGVPQEVVVMWLPLRHAMMLLTRFLEVDNPLAYRKQLREARACLFAYAATAEHLHSTRSNDPSLIQFKFTWKLHRYATFSIKPWTRAMQSSPATAGWSDYCDKRRARYASALHMKGTSAESEPRACPMHVVTRMFRDVCA